ncbi:MAG: MotA/TolQ/ExbB proton channel family protein [Balneolaceae bacterium]
MIHFLFQTTNGAEADTLSEMLMEETSMSFLDVLTQGGILMIPLFILSVLAIYVIAERWRFLNNNEMEVDPFLNTIEAMLKSGDQTRALEHCDKIDKPLPRILKSGIRRLGRPIRDIQESIHNAGKKEIFQLEKRMNWLATIAGVAPLVGFTGTVTGMIRAFMDIQALQGNVNPSVLAGGIWEALITTATGLIVGIIAYGFYNFLLGKINRTIFELENASADFIDLLQSPSPKKQQPRSEVNV